MKYCQECGHEAQDNAKFCPECGTSLDFVESGVGGPDLEESVAESTASQ